MKTPMLDSILSRMEKTKLTPMGFLITHRFTDAKGNNEGIRITPMYLDTSSGHTYDLSLAEALALYNEGEILVTTKNSATRRILGDYIEPFPLNNRIWMRTKGNTSTEDNINHLQDLGRLPR